MGSAEMDLEQGLLVGEKEDEPARKEWEVEETMGEWNNVVMLTDKSQLMRLASLLRSNEEAVMQRLTMKSEQERVEYLTGVRDAYRKTVALLDDCKEDGGDVRDCVVYGLNLCLQTLRDCRMRVDALDKLRAHYHELIIVVAQGDPPAAAAVAGELRASMWEYCYSHRNAAAYSNPKAPRRLDIPELLRRHQLRLGYAKYDFEDLTESQKQEVIASIRADLQQQQPILLSGKGRRSAARTTLAEAVSVFTTEHKVEAILNVMAAVGAFAVTAAVTKAVAGAGIFACSLAGLVAGGLVFIFLSAGRLIMGSHSQRKVPPIRDLKFHTAVMPPDGITLAHQIATSNL